MRRAGAVVLVLLATLVGRAAAESEKDRIAAELVKAVGRDDGKRIAAALDRAVALVGKDPSVADLFELGEWIGTLQASVYTHPVVMVRRGWMYLTAKRPADAAIVLEAALVASPKDAVARAYLGEAKRQSGEAMDAARELGHALRDGAPADFVMPSLTKMLFELRREPAPPTGLPAYANAAAAFLAGKEEPSVRIQLARWLAFDAEGLKKPEDAARRTAMYATAVRTAWPVITKPVEGWSPARLAFEGATWRAAVGDAAPGDLPDRYDLLSASVRAGASADSDEVPEAVAALAELALEEGRYHLAHAMAKRRLATSDSPAARRVLLALPPDVGR